MGVFSGLLDRRLTLQRMATGTDSVGGVTRTWPTTLATNVPASVQPADARVQQQYAQRTMVVTHLLFFETDQHLELDDRAYDGTSYYLVRGYRSFVNAALRGASHYIADCELQLT